MTIFLSLLMWTLLGFIAVEVYVIRQDTAKLLRENERAKRERFGRYPPDLGFDPIDDVVDRARRSTDNHPL